MRISIISIFMLPTLLFIFPLQAADFSAEVGIEAAYSSNIFMNSQKLQDFSLSPQLSLDVDFADYWSFGYSGVLDIYTQNTDLFSHEHMLYLYANPAWGKESQNEFFAQLSLGTERHTDSYSSINVVTPDLQAGLSLEPVDWFRWSLNEDVKLEWFYDDKGSNYFDTWTSTSWQFTLQSRTTIKPYIAYGFRYYLQTMQSGNGDSSDQQLKPGIHLSQGLWDNAGLQADYAYLYAFENSGLIARKQDSVDFNYIEESFIFRGHQAALEFKQLFAEAWTFNLGIGFEERKYGGWSALNADGSESGEDRRDLRLPLFTGIEYAWFPDENAAASVPAVKVNLAYAYLRQWSNDAWYDTDRHNISLSLWLDW